jgi:hypothetical protein
MIVGAALRYRLCFATSLSPVPYQARLNPSLSVFDRDPLPFCAVARPWMRTRSASPRRRGRRGGRGSPREDDGLRRNIGRAGHVRHRGTSTLHRRRSAAAMPHVPIRWSATARDCVTGRRSLEEIDRRGPVRGGQTEGRSGAPTIASLRPKGAERRSACTESGTRQTGGRPGARLAFVLSGPAPAV